MKINISHTVHYNTLDGLRGVAAIVVLFTHASLLLPAISVPSGSLAVDLFFMLSGFVIMHAYSSKIILGLSIVEFMKIRIIRLYPMYAVGALFGFTSIALDIYFKSTSLPLYEIGINFLCLAFMIPSFYPTALGEIFPINSPRWSLFFEMSTNLFFVFFMKSFYSKLKLLAVTIISCIILIVGVGVNHTYELGWNLDTLPWGFPRAAAPFWIGCLIYTSIQKKQSSNPLACIIPFCLVPIFASEAMSSNKVSLIIVFALFPIVVSMGSRIYSNIGPANSLLGVISYPLYITHYPYLLIAETFYDYIFENDKAYKNLYGIAVLISCIFLSWVLAIYIDPFIRTRLSKWVNSSSSKPIKK